LASVDLDPSTAGRQTTFINSEGTYTADNSGNVTFTPGASFVGIATPINYTINDDGSGGTTAISTSNLATITITVGAGPPTITVTNANPIVSAGTTSTNIPYSAVTGSPSQYRIDFDAAANIAGLADVPPTGLPASPITITSLEALPAGTYHGTLYVKNTDINTESIGTEITITVSSASQATVLSSPATAVTATSATLGGDVNSDGGSTVTERGVVYSTSINPTTSDTKTQVGSGTGVYSQSVTGLSPGTTYHFRAYAINSLGTSYGSDQLFTTITITHAPSPFPYSESFKNSTAPEMVFGGSPVAATLTAANGLDANGSGYLRLTTASSSQSGFARDTTIFPTSNGLSVSFEYFTYGGTGADGFTFFLFDADVVHRAPNAAYTTGGFNIGGFGGSLGYAQNTTNHPAGLSKGYLAIGFDEFGNFSNPSQGRQGGPGQKPSSVTLRGDGDGTGAGSPAGSNYEYLTSIQTTNATAMAAAGGGSTFSMGGGVNGRTGGGLSASSSGYRKAKIELLPNGSGTGYVINVWITEGNAGGGTVHHVVTNYSYISTGAIPANLSYGFAASTGGSNNYHEIRNLEILVPAGIELAPTVADITKTGTENVTIPFTSQNFTSKFSSPSGNTLVKIKVTSLPNSGTLRLNGTDIEVNQEINFSDVSGITFVPAPNYVGTTTFQWNGSDGTLYAESNANVSMTVSAAVSHNFTINAIANSTVNENSVYTGLSPAITGTPAGSLTYTLGGPDAFDFSINPSTGVVSMIPRNFESPADANTDNVYEVTITAMDTENNSATQHWTVTVLNVVEAATFSINPIANATVNENTVYTGVTPAITGTPIGGTAPANFTIVPIPDTQFYTGELNGGSNAIFKAQTNWVATNKNAVGPINHLQIC